MSGTHGERHHPLYMTHYNMMRRCYNPDAEDYPNYGGRGIEVCPGWHDIAAFIAWIEANLGPRPDGCTLDRIDNDGNYQAGNVKWSTAAEQGRKRHSSHLLSLNGETKCITEWSETVGINRSTIYTRLQRGWSVERALTMSTRNTRLLTLDGETKSLAEWSRDIGIDRTTIRDRLRLGWSVERALTTPVTRHMTLAEVGAWTGGRS